jgi:hypothetical protein
MRTYLSAISVLLMIPAPAAAQPAVAPASSLPAPDAASLALAHQIVTIAFPPEKRVQMFSSRIDLVVEQARKSMQNALASKDPDFQTLIDHNTARMFNELKASMSADLPDYFESVTRAYARDFSLDDLNAILAFVKSPAGQHYFERAQQLLKDPDVQATTQRMMSHLMGKMPELQRQSMREVQDYVAKNAKQKKAVQAKPVT